MKVISTNIAKPQTIIWKGNEELTGIYKKSVEKIFLGKTDVAEDSVIDRKFHGGENKACYLYSSTHYNYWKEKYLDLEWQWGMFGENLTIENLFETEIYIGDTFRIGEAIIQISEPRLPCYKLGIRFGTPKIIKEFTNSTYCGAYARVIQEGFIEPQDQLIVSNRSTNIKLSELYRLLTVDKKNKKLIEKAMSEPAISSEIKNKLIQ